MDKKLLLIISLAGLVIFGIFGSNIVGTFAIGGQYGTRQGSDCPTHDGFTQEGFDVMKKAVQTFPLSIQDLHQTSFYA